MLHANGATHVRRVQCRERVDKVTVTDEEATDAILAVASDPGARLPSGPGSGPRRDTHRGTQDRRAGDDLVVRPLQVAVVVREDADALPPMLASLPQAVRRPMRVVVADTAMHRSVDQTSLDVLDHDGDRPVPRAQIVTVGGHLGVAAGINVAVRHLDPDGPLLVTMPGFVFSPGSVDVLLSALDDGVGAVVPRLTRTDGVTLPSVVQLRRPWATLRRALGGAGASGPRILAAPALDPSGHAAVVDGAIGPMLLSEAGRGAVRVWDESLRSDAAILAVHADLKARGLRVLHVPSAQVQVPVPAIAAVRTRRGELPGRADRAEVAVERVDLARHTMPSWTRAIRLASLVGEGVRGILDPSAREAAVVLRSIGVDEQPRLGGDGSVP